LSIPEKCPLCSSGPAKQSVVTSHVYGKRNKRSSAFFHCKNCDVRYQFPSLSEEEEVLFYTEEFESFMSSRSGESGGWLKAEQHVEANQKTYQRRIKYLSSFLEPKMNILEVGCSSGFMLYPLINDGHNCVGIEPSGVFSNFLSDNGIEVYDSLDNYKKINESQSFFDLIMHYFVLEHISDPINFLKSQLELISSNGKIIFEIPNVADPLASIYDIPAFERFYWSLAHPWYFSESSLDFLLSQLGVKYEIHRDQRYDLSNHIIWARDGKPGGMERFTSKIGIDIEEQYKKALVKSGYCDTLIAVVYKY